LFKSGAPIRKGLFRTGHEYIPVALQVKNVRVFHDPEKTLPDRSAAGKDQIGPE
jgi:hypothetical protein